MYEHWAVIQARPLTAGMTALYSATIVVPTISAVNMESMSDL
jgi:hypothetical protein